MDGGGAVPGAASTAAAKESEGRLSRLSTEFLHLAFEKIYFRWQILSASI
jgi:hypothetical protein